MSKKSDDFKLASGAHDEGQFQPEPREVRDADYRQNPSHIGKVPDQNEITWLAPGQNPKAVILNTGPSDVERAEDYRDRIGLRLGQIADLMTEARRHGLTVGFQIAGPDAFNRHVVAMLEVSKKLA